MVDLDKVLALIRPRNEEGVEHITSGAMAMGVHALPRATEAAGFFIAPTAENIERLERARIARIRAERFPNR